MSKKVIADLQLGIGSGNRADSGLTVMKLVCRLLEHSCDPIELSKIQWCHPHGFGRKRQMTEEDKQFIIGKLNSVWVHGD